MNRIYKSIWNEQTGTYVAVSENVKAKGKRSGASLLAGVALAMVVGASAQAQNITIGSELPVTGDTIVFSSGTGTISGLGNGALNASSTEAVNGAQLFQTNEAVALKADQTALNDTNAAVIENENDIAALDTRVTTSEGKIGTLETGLGTANTNISGLTTRVTTAEGKIDTLETDLGTANTNISGLTTRVGETETDITTLKTTLSDLGVAETTPGIKYFRVNSDKADASATGVDSVAIGPEAVSSGLNSIALGFMTQAQAENAFAAGVGAVVTEEGESAIALGDGAIAGGAALGSGGIAAIAIGRGSKASGTSSVALGDATVASASKATALGAGSTATAANAIAIGGGLANATGSFAAGSGAVVAAGSSNSIALGTGAGAGINPGDADDRIDLIAIGTNAGRNVGGSQNIAIGAGSGSDVSGYFNLALGQNSGTGLGVGSDSVVSIGRQANHKVGEILQHAVAIGSYTNAATNAVSIGHKSDALVGGIAIGYDADAAENAVALGTNANAVSGSVALGLNSAASALDWAGTSYLTNQATPDSVVSVGNRNEGGGDATLRRIVNVADGAATSDAATVGQLQKAQTEVASLIGGGVTVQGDGSFSDFTIKDKSGTEHTFSTVAAGFALLANGEINLLPSDAVTFVSDTDKRITGVAAGTDNSDVVNVGQLTQALTDNKVQYFHVNSSIGANQGNNGAAGTNAMAIGPAASAGGDSSIAFGHDVTTSAAQSIAIGNDVDAIGLQSTVIGNSGTMAINEGGVAIGKNAHSYGENAIVIGTGARSHLADSDEPNHNTVVIGTSAEATADNGTAIGMDAVATDERAVALGTTAQARGEDSMAFGSNAIATGVSSQASGTNANASGLNAQASGTGASASGYNAVATGTRAVGYATDGIAMGTGAVSGFSDPLNTDAERNTAGIAIGNQSLADQEHALALGVEAEARAKSSAAIGDNAEATAAAENGFAAGTNALVSAQNATAVGANTDATGVNASAFGNGAQATAGSALALGDSAKASATNSTAMGTGANAQKANSMALGTNATAYHEGSVALGSGSVTGTVNVTRTPDATVDGVKYDFAGAQTGVISTVSVGSVGNERTISNVAAGQLTETSTDAINGSQLHATNKAVTALGNDLDTFGGSVAGALGGTSKYDPATHTVTAGLSVNGNEYTNVNDALQYVGKGWDVSGSETNKVNIGPGGAVDFKGDNNISVAQTGEKDAGVIAINLAKDVDLGADGSLTTGNTKVNNTGVTVGSGEFDPTTTVEAGKIVVTSAGGAGNNQSIVLDTSPTKAEITGLTNTTWDPAGTYDAGRAATEEQLKAVSDVAQNANQGWNVTTNADDKTSQKVAPGATVDFDNTDGNIVIAQDGTNLTFDLNNDLLLGEVGQPGKDGVDGKIGVTGKDGASVVLNGKDGTIGLTGPAGANGEPGASADLGVQYGKPGLDGNDGVNGTSKTRIVYKKPNGTTEEVATLNDGLKFKGDDGKEVERKLNETLGLAGGADIAKLSKDNIGVVAELDKDGKPTGNMSIQLAKDLTGLNSATFTNGSNTIVINAEAGDITGLSNTTWDPAGTYDDGRAATEEQLKKVSEVAQNANKGWNVTTNEADKTALVASGAAVDFNNTDGNIVIAQDGTNLTFDLNNDLLLGEVGQPGKDGVDGKIGVTGKDGASVVLNGKDGTIGLTGPAGANGEPGASAALGVQDGKPGLAGNDGVNGESKTRIVYKKPDGTTEEVATLNDGLKFKGDDGKEVERKLNETLGLAGGADIAKLSKDNIGVVAELDDDDKPTGNMSIQLAKDLTGLNSATFTKGTNTTVINHSGLRIKDGPSVTVTGIDAGSKKITHVAPGVISKTSTDAVNGSQLWSLADSVQEIFGGNVSFDFNVDTGKFEFTSPTYTINDKPYDNVQDAIDKLAEGWKVTVNDPGTGTGTGTGGTPGTGTGGPADIKAGDQLTLVAGDNIDITQGTKKPGVGNEPANVDITISVDPNLVVNSVTAGNSKLDTTGLVVKNPETENSTVVNGDGLSFVTKDGDQIGPSVSVIKGINAGNKKITHVAKGTAGTDAVNVDQLKGVVTALGGGSEVNADGTIKAPTYTVGKDKDGEGKNVFNNVGDAVSELNKGWTLQTNGLKDQQIQSGDIVNFANNDGNIVITQVVNSAGVVDVQFDLGETINVETVKATTVNATTVNATTVNASTFKAGNTIVNNNGVSFVNNEGDQVGPSVSVDGINAGGKTITNVAPGVNETDAVNVGQLQGAVTNINNQINSVRGDLRRVDRDARAGTASAAAMANLPQAYLPGKSVFAIATAGHRGEQGYAAGLSTISDNGKWILKGSVSGNSRGDATYGAGVGYQW